MGTGALLTLFGPSEGVNTWNTWELWLKQWDENVLKSSRRLGRQVTWGAPLKVPVCNRKESSESKKLAIGVLKKKSQALAGRLHENQWRGKRGADTSAPKCLPVTHQHFVLHSVSLHFQLHLLLHWDFDLPANHILYAFWKKGKVSLFPFFSKEKGH